MNQVNVEALEKKEVYSQADLALVNQAVIPRHIALIMDGNRRWAKNNHLPVASGHFEGAEVIDGIVRAASSLGVKVITTYAFSTENWGRSPDEVETLLNLFELYLTQKREMLVKEGVKLETIGDISRFPEKIKKALRETQEVTKDCSRIVLVLALNYGSRDEIRRAVINAAEDLSLGTLKKHQLTEDVFASYLDTAKWGDPDLLIRTSGEMRLSNFLLWQLSYAEIIVTDVLWPEFTETQFLKCIMEFQRRHSRKGE